MKYLMLVGTEVIDDPLDTPDDIERWVTEHDASGARFFGDRLAPSSEARTVRVRRSGTLVTDGPLAPSHDAIAGIDILEAGSMEEAVRIAADHPMAARGVIEVRPFFDWSTEDEGSAVE